MLPEVTVTTVARSETFHMSLTPSPDPTDTSIDSDLCLLILGHVAGANIPSAPVFSVFLGSLIPSAPFLAPCVPSRWDN